MRIEKCPEENLGVTLCAVCYYVLARDSLVRRRRLGEEAKKEAQFRAAAAAHNIELKRPPYKFAKLRFSTTKSLVSTTRLLTTLPASSKNIFRLQRHFCLLWTFEKNSNLKRLVTILSALFEAQSPFICSLSEGGIVCELYSSKFLWL